MSARPAAGQGSIVHAPLFHRGRAKTHVYRILRRGSCEPRGMRCEAAARHMHMPAPFVDLVVRAEQLELRDRALVTVSLRRSKFESLHERTESTFSAPSRKLFAVVVSNRVRALARVRSTSARRVRLAGIFES